MMMGLLAFILSTNSTNLITYPVTTVGRNNVTSTSCFMDTNVNIVTNFIAITLRIYAPFFLMLSLNIIVINRLRNSKKRVGISVAGQGGKISRKEYKFTVATLIMDFIFLGMNFPVSVWLTMSIIDLFTDRFTSDAFTNAAYSFYSNMAQIVAFSYSMAGIFMFITFNRNFRIEFINLLGLGRFFLNHVRESSIHTRTHTQLAV